MAVVTNLSIKKYIGNAVTVIFPTGFEFFESTTVQVEVDKVVQTDGVHYDLTGGSGAQGTVTFKATDVPPAPAVAGTTNVVLRRIEPRTQSADFTPGGAFPADTADIVHDRLVYIEQEQDEEFSRALVIPANNIAASWNGELPDPGDPALLPTTGTYVMRIQATGVTYVLITSTDIAQPLMTKGAIMTYTTAPDQLLPGVDGLELNTNASKPTGLEWVQRAAPQGQCQLIGDAFGAIDLNPHDGDVVMLKVGANWVVRHVPVAGTLTITAAGLTLNSLYYIYLKDVSGTLTLFADDDAPVLDTDTLFWVKSADPTKLLVGMGYVTTGPTFLDNPATRHVRSWFHDPGVMGYGEMTGDAVTAMTSYVASDSGMNVSTVNWPGELMRVDHVGAMEVSAAATFHSAISTDGTTADTDAEVLQAIITAGINLPVLIPNRLQIIYTTTALRTFSHLIKTSTGSLTVEGTGQPGKYRAHLWTGGHP